MLSRAHLSLLLAASLLAGCSTFDRDWKTMALTPVVDAEPNGIEGQWSGTWRSDANGHGGGLRCMLDVDDAGMLLARYHATYARVLTFEYTVPMTLRQEGDTYHFAGEADLGWMAGGAYTYEGTVIGDQFRSTYECARDHGTFEMTRVTPAADQAAR